MFSIITFTVQYLFISPVICFLNLYYNVLKSSTMHMTELAGGSVIVYMNESNENMGVMLKFPARYPLVSQ